MPSLSKFIASNERVIWGWFFLIFGSIFFSGFFFAAVISKLLPPSDYTFLSAIQNDRYYCFLVPLTLPVIVFAVYFHWLSMKLFKHALLKWCFPEVLFSCQSCIPALLRSNDISALLQWNRAYIAGMSFGEIGCESEHIGWRRHLARDVGQTDNRPVCDSRNVVAWKNYSTVPSSQFGQSLGNGPDLSRDFFVQLWVQSKERLQSVEMNRKQRLRSSAAPVVGEKSNGYVTPVLNQPPTSQSMSGPLKPSSPEEARIAPLVARSTLLITRDIEWTNLVAGFEQENRYNIVDRCYPTSPVGFIRENSNVIARQLLRSRRPFVAHILDASGNELFRVRRPFWWINSTIYVEVDGKEIGVVHRRWHLWRRLYDLYLGNKQFAEVVNPGLWNWTFTLKGLDDEVLAQIDRNWRGFGFELFTDAGQYVIAFGSAEHSSVPLAGVQELQVTRPLTISERAVAIALAVSLDNDYFSVHGGWHLPFYLAE